MRDRKLNRLRGFNYSQSGYYFITICTKNKEEWFGRIENEEMILNKYGKIVSQCWYDLPNHYSNCSLGSFVIMPNHVHGIIMINDKNAVGNGLKPFPTHGLSEIMRGFKTFSSRKINEAVENGNRFQWQKSFYDHVIRNEKSLDNLRQYIQNNPLKWELDIENIRSGAIRSSQKSDKDYYKKIIHGGSR